MATGKNKLQETQLSLTNCATHLRKCNGVVDLLKHAPPHMCYYAEFGRSALHDVHAGINTGELQKLRSSLGMGGVADHTIHAFIPLPPRQIW